LPDELSSNDRKPYQVHGVAVECEAGDRVVVLGDGAMAGCLCAVLAHQSAGGVAIRGNVNWLQIGAKLQLRLLVTTISWTRQVW